MRTSFLRTAGAALAAAALMATPVAGAQARPSNAASPAPARASVHPGFAGVPINVGTYGTIDGYDLGTDAAGTTYFGWIGSRNDNLRVVHLCVLKPGARSCTGGVLDATTADPAGAAGLHVIVTSTGHATLVWFDDSSGAAHLSSATYASGKLSAATLDAAAQDNGYLLDARLGPHGQIWWVTRGSALDHYAIVHTSLTDPGTKVNVPTEDLDARLTFVHSTAVMALVDGAEIGQGVYYTTKGAGAWSAVRHLAHTWNAGDAFGLVTTPSGAHLLAVTDDADYKPVVSKLSGTTFGTPRIIDNGKGCTPSTHDPVTDQSGRIADVSTACSQLLVTDLPDGLHAAALDLPSGGTIAGGQPQITTQRNGSGWVAWGIEGTGGDALRVAPIRLPSTSVTVSKSGRPGIVVVTGPRSCLPAVDAPALVKAKAARGWKLVGKTLELGPVKVVKVVHGSSLRSGKVYTLTGTGTFKHTARPVVTQKVVAKLRFKVC